MGLEPHPQMYIDHLVQISREIKRVLKNSGSYYLNLGNTYYGSGGAGGDYDNKGLRKGQPKYRQNKSHRSNWLKPKQLMMMPARVAIALQDVLGFTLRNDIIWYKPNSMPSSVKDRLSNTYEHVFHFVKNRKYYYDLDAIRVPHKTSLKDLNRRIKENRDRGSAKKYGNGFSQCSFRDKVKERKVNRLGKNPGDVILYDSKYEKDKYGQSLQGYRRGQSIARERQQSRIDAKRLFPNDLKRQKEYINFIHDHSGHPHGKNPGDFWNICTRPFPDAHFAVYPEALCERPIKSSCPKEGIVLDMFVGAGTTLVVAKKLGRRFLGCEINPEYVKIARKRLAQVQPSCE